MKSWTIICGSRRDQEEGGGAGLSWRAGQSFAGPGEIKRREVELDSREELDNHLRVQARSRGGRWRWTLVKSWTIIYGSRRDQEEGGGDGLSWRAGQSFTGPGEIKRREVELDSHEELDNHLRVQARSRGGRWRWTLVKSWTIICGAGRDQEEGGGAWPAREPRRDQEQGGRAGLWTEVEQLFTSVVFQQLPYGHCLWFCSAQMLKQQLAKYTSCVWVLARSPHCGQFWRWLTVSSVFADRSAARTSYSLVLSLPSPQ